MPTTETEAFHVHPELWLSLSGACPQSLRGASRILPGLLVRPQQVDGGLPGRLRDARPFLAPDPVFDGPSSVDVSRSGPLQAGAAWARRATVHDLEAEDNVPRLPVEDGTTVGQGPRPQGDASGEIPSGFTSGRASPAME